MENSSDTACQENRRVVQAGDALCSVRFRSRQRNLRGCIPYHTFEWSGKNPRQFGWQHGVFSSHKKGGEGFFIFKNEGEQICLI